MLSHIQRSIADIPRVRMERIAKLSPSRDVPILVVELEEGLGKAVEQVIRDLNTGDPGIYVPRRPNGFSINPHTLLEGSQIPTPRRLRQVLAD
jgi:hypothetical protein